MKQQREGCTKKKLPVKDWGKDEAMLYILTEGKDETILHF
jgi:hypothetical protein